MIKVGHSRLTNPGEAPLSRWGCEFAWFVVRFHRPAATLTPAGVKNFFVAGSDAFHNARFFLRDPVSVLAQNKRSPLPVCPHVPFVDSPPSDPRAWQSGAWKKGTYSLWEFSTGVPPGQACAKFAHLSHLRSRAQFEELMR